mmetsp:Transcript_83940/g.102825  ORF Transcript_83940/g.102825 Transcript_83940/m.102825 type:complete len:221 (+) Transcript_83940:330-992(+)
MQAAIARAVHGIGIGSTIQEEFHHCYSVGTNGISQRSDALVVLRIQWLLLGQKILHCLQVAVLGGLVQSQCSLINLLQNWLQFRWKAAHLLADLQHEVFILVVLHGRIQTILLDVFKDTRQLWVLLQGLHTIRHGRIAVHQPGVVVLSNGLGLEPTSHSFRILGKALQGFGCLWVAFDVFLHVVPGALVDVGQSCNLHGGAITDLQSFSGGFCGHLATLC